MEGNNGQVTGSIGVDEFAETLGVCPRTILRMDSAGEIPEPLKLGRRLKRWGGREVSMWIEYGCPLRNRWKVIWGNLRGVGLN